MINLTKDEFSEVVAEVIKEFVNAVEDEALVPLLLTICAMIGARAEMKTEEKYNLEQVANSLFCYNEKFCVGDWIISIRGPIDSTNKACLNIKYKGETRVNCVVDSIHKAYNYAFNILVN